MALLLKELRECSLYAGLALLAQIHFLGDAAGLPLIGLLHFGQDGEIPFLPQYYVSNREQNFTLIATVAAIVLGLHQTVWESWRQTTLFLLHRPLPRVQLFLIKISAGAVCLAVFAVLPLAVYSFWAAIPGTHASPYYWGMTEDWWLTVLTAGICYLGAFLTGLRSAHWLGSRTWPLIAALVASLGLKEMTFHDLHIAPAYTLALACAGGVLLIAGYLVLILDTAARREFP